MVTPRPIMRKTNEMKITSFRILKACSKECDLIHGECVQTYVPYLFLVIPLGPVTLTGQDYVLVESGCSCRPKYAPPGSDPNPTAIIPNF